MVASKWLMAALATAAFAPLQAIAAEAVAAADQAVSSAPNSGVVPSTQAAPSGVRVEEIVVTAERRAVNMQKVPIAVTAVTGATLANQNIQTSNDLITMVPGLQIVTESGDTRMYLRGVGTSATATDNSVALYVDGVYIAGQSASMLDLNNIARVEVLKGPQGTLFGRNATGGVVQIITKDPSQTPSADLTVGYANYSTVQTNFYGTTKVFDNLAADLSVYYNDQMNGWGRNITDNVPIYRGNALALRSKWLWTPDSATRVTFSVDFEKDRQATGMLEGLIPGALGIDGKTSYVGFYNAAGNLNDQFTDQNWGLMLKVEHDFNWARFVSITGYRNSHNIQWLDQDATPVPLVNAAPLPIIDTTFSQELQLLSPKDSKLQWIAGLFYLDDLPKSNPLQISGLAFAPLSGEDVWVRFPTQSYAVFGQATYPILPDTHLTVGLRYTEDDKSIKGTTIGVGPGEGESTILMSGSQANQFTKLTYRFALDHQFTPDILGYVSYNRGFKSGQYSEVNYNLPAVKPEVLDAYEGGFKTELFDHRFRLNIAGFYYNYQDIQIEELVLGGTELVNAASAHIYGVDGDFSAAISSVFSVQGGFSFLHGRYADFPNGPAYVPAPGGGNELITEDESGNSTIETPAFTGNIAGTYKVPTEWGDFAFNLNYSYNSGFYWNTDNRLKQPEYNLLGAYVGWTAKGGRWDIRVWANNLTGARYYSDLDAFSLGDAFSPAAPRTYGVTLGAHF